MGVIEMVITGQRDREKDSIIDVLEQNTLPLKAFGRAWQLLYEIYGGNAPLDIGKLREQLFTQMLKREYKLKVVECLPTEREADFIIDFGNGEKKTYSFKSCEVNAKKDGGPGAKTVKVSWDNFPTDAKKSGFSFNYDILLLMGGKQHNRLFVAVFDAETLNNEKERIGYENFFTKSKSDKNPRGFGIVGKVVEELVQRAQKQGNFIAVDFPALPEASKKSFRSRYWDNVYKNVFEVAKKGLQ